MSFEAGAGFGRRQGNRTETIGTEERLGERELSKLRWRCRRGLLENDLFIERFFRQYEETITTKQAEGLTALMELADNDLLDLLLGRTEPQGEVDTAAVHAVLAQMRRPPLPVSLPTSTN